MNQNMLIWLEETRMNQMDHHVVSDRNLKCPLLPQSDYAISFKSLKARTLVESSYLAKPEVLRHISELLVLELTSKSNDCHNQIQK